jgi:hypothetical protein
VRLHKKWIPKIAFIIREIKFRGFILKKNLVFALVCSLLFRIVLSSKQDER